MRRYALKVGVITLVLTCGADILLSAFAFLKLWALPSNSSVFLPILGIQLVAASLFISIVGCGFAVVSVVLDPRRLLVWLVGFACLASALAPRSILGLIFDYVFRVHNLTAK